MINLSNKQLKKIVNVIVAIFAIVLFVKSFVIDTRQERLNRGLENIKEEEFQGVVIKKGFEKYNHNASMIYLNNESKFAIFGQFWSQIKIDDSIVKRKGETFFTIYRNNKMFVLDNREIIEACK
ncbi:hypothetical protein K6T82_01035 [Flavobacterium sp. 17A]|uniref:Uncharacterized protein n=1 Tax=Flavobacterium potami TaxID=2872310 RepID=A0A9X1H748_9FLAO|nr:hypothetical protein [Flavobacterium potami]MBZ4033332.1 hypothetical protein [Flavobacterium potami]